MIEFIQTMGPWLWVAVLVACIVIEAVTMGLTTIWGAIAAVPMIFVAKTGMPLKWQLLIFAVVTVLLIIFTRPFAVKKLHNGKSKTNVNTMIGEEVLITKAIVKFQKGEAKAKNGVIWTAKADNGEEIPEGKICKVVDVQGNTISVVEA